MGSDPVVTVSDRRVATLAIVVIALAALMGPTVLLLRGGRSSAAFSDSEVVGANHLGAATLDVAVGDETAQLVATRMAPGDTVTGWLDLANGGDLPLRYAIVTDSTIDILLDWLRWDVWKASGACVPPAGLGTYLLSDAQLIGGLSSPLIGSSALGLDRGDRVLQPGSAERICIGATLQTDAPNAVQARSVTMDLTVVAEHHLVGDGP
jgi:hypothetical protein